MFGMRSASWDRSLPDSLSRRRQPLDLAPPEAAGEMIVHHAGGLHERIADRGSYEPEPVGLEIAAQPARDLRLGRHLARLAPPVLHRTAVDESPQVRVERAVLTLDGQHRPCVGDGGRDLGAIAHDAGIAEQCPRAGGGEPRHRARIEPGKRASIGRALGEDRRPAEPRLRALEDEELEQPPVVVHRHAPFLVVIALHRRTRGPRAALHDRAHTAQASTSHPAMKAAPPTGVTAPSQRCPLTASKYRVPQKTTVPAMKSQPASATADDGHRERARPTASKPSAWYIW